MISRLRRIFCVPYILFPIVAILFGSIFVAITPPLWGFDEPAHFARVYQLVNGHVKPDTGQDTYGGVMPKSFSDLHWYRGADMFDNRYKTGDSILQRQDVTDSNAYSDLLNKDFSGNQVQFPWTAMNSPFAYPGPLVATWISQLLSLDIGQTLHLARFASLVVYILLTSLAIYVVRNLKRLVWFVFFVALLPTCLFQASTINADSILMALTTLFTVLYMQLLLKSKDTPSRPTIAALACIGVILPLIKIHFIIISLLVVLIPIRYFISKKYAYIFRFIMLLAVSLPGIIWSRISGATTVPHQSQLQDSLPVIPSEQVIYILSRPFDFVVALIKTLIVHGNDTIVGMFFTISGTGVALPLVMMFAVVGMIVILGLNAKNDLLKIKKEIIIAGVVALLVAVATYVAVYAVFNPVGWWFIDGVQGRYFTPLIIPIALAIAMILPIKMQLKNNIAMRLSIGIIILVLAVAVIYGYLALY